MPARLQFTESASQLKTNMRFMFAEAIDKLIRSKINGIELFARNSIKNSFNKSETVSAILGGILQADFGLTDDMAVEAVDSIVEYVSNNVQIIYTKSKKTSDLLASFTLVFLPNKDFYKEIKNGSYISEGIYVTGYGINGDVNWLEWLVTKGTQVILSNFYVYYEEGKGRSNQAIMIYTDKAGSTRSGGFMVNPEHAGTEDDNFVTRAINESIPIIRAFIQKEMS